MTNREIQKARDDASVKQDRILCIHQCISGLLDERTVTYRLFSSLITEYYILNLYKRDGLMNRVLSCSFHIHTDDKQTIINIANKLQIHAQ